MSEIKDSEHNIVKELQKIKKRLDRIHSWITGFIILYIVFSLISIWL